MHLLTIESTCDETAAAVIDDRLQVKARSWPRRRNCTTVSAASCRNSLRRAHLERMLPVIDQTLRKAGVSLAEIDAVAVATTPGLAGSLLVGLAAAKALCVA